MTSKNLFLKTGYICLVFFIIASMFLPKGVWAEENDEINEEGLYERTDGYYKMVDEDDDILMKTGRILNTGNKYLNQDNELYKVVDIEDDVARAEFVEEVDLDATEAKVTADESLEARKALQNDERTIGLYHSHGAESYVPSDGEESIDEGGGIIQVGMTLRDSLEGRNINAIWSDETHVPHDAGAYSRSRRTVEELMQQNPDALIDIHRDAAPREEYKVDLGFDEVVHTLLVVGQQQPNFEENKAFAESIKATGDEMYDGFIKGILYADGSYNQDLHPRNILIELGGHENTRESAQASASLFAGVLNETLYGGEEGAGAGPADQIVDGEGGVAGRVARSVVWIIGLLIIAVGIFLAINYKNLDQVKERLKHFFTKEFSNFLGPQNSNRDKNQGEDENKEDKDKNE
ncbi:stage II sporulation protein P [Natranaerofaba carboxydovora]|uniref:stage II sporulation protein P n=1 Tax=Natranaerofaba carboxydovora TaxID=2742683 RepID=UPI001F13ECC4|nr:stage II sporulation protein P [Natranaerofaba carboxydovora]UMZ73889.1 Stage II sporulation protein P (SpoIIP) [Natranaerofaba carboxydovora]